MADTNTALRSSQRGIERLMRLRNRIASAVAVSAVAGVAFAGTANAAPDFSDCPTTAPDAIFCVDIASTAGTLRINSVEIPLGTAFEIRGALTGTTDADGYSTLIAPTGTSGLFTAPVAVPGGISGSSTTASVNRLTAEIKAAGPIGVDQYSFSVRVPVKIKLKNQLVGTCRLGSNEQPIVLTLPVTEYGVVDLQPTYFTYAGTRYADTTFTVPASRGCDLPYYGNLAINSRFGLPAAAGSNSLTLTTDASATLGL